MRGRFHGKEQFSMQRAAEKDRDSYQAGRNAAANEISQRSLTPATAWTLNWHDLGRERADEYWLVLARLNPSKRRLAWNVVRIKEAFQYGYWEAFKEFAGPYPEESTTPVKTCPMCAEEVKSAALICRFCGFDFEQDQQGHQ